MRARVRVHGMGRRARSVCLSRDVGGGGAEELDLLMPTQQGVPTLTLAQTRGFVLALRPSNFCRRGAAARDSCHVSLLP